MSFFSPPLLSVLYIEKQAFKIRAELLLAVVTLTLYSASAFGFVTDLLPGDVQTRFHEPHEVVDIYFKAIDKGELVAFDTTLTKDMLIPVSVEYVYLLNSTAPRIKVFSKLKQPLPVPGQQDCELRAVSSTLDSEGHIIETEVHIWSK